MTTALIILPLAAALVVWLLPLPGRVSGALALLVALTEVALWAGEAITDTAIIRVEQLYPMPVEELREALAQFPNAEDFAWVQEEPANQGAWSFIALNLLEHLEGVRLRRISRPAAAAPAVGSTKMHDVEQAALIEAAMPRQ